jgi:hypothetical protein
VKFFGFFLVVAGFLAGAYYLTGAGGNVLGPGFFAVFVVAVAGVIILRVATRKRKGAVEKVAADMNTVERTLSSLASGVADIERNRDSIDVYDLSRQIENRFNEDLEKFVEARESIATAFGLPVYADVMSHFAAGERYLNRVWSCSVDGYIDESHEYITRARTQFEESHAILSKNTGPSMS